MGYSWYDSFGSVGDDNVGTSYGHGTKVAGVVAGQLENDKDGRCTGVAKDAKLHIWDIMFGTPCLLFEKYVFELLLCLFINRA